MPDSAETTARMPASLQVASNKPCAAVAAVSSSPPGPGGTASRKNAWLAARVAFKCLASCTAGFLQRKGWMSSTFPGGSELALKLQSATTEPTDSILALYPPLLSEQEITALARAWQLVRIGAMQYLICKRQYISCQIHKAV